MLLLLLNSSLFNQPNGIIVFNFVPVKSRRARFLRTYLMIFAPMWWLLSYRGRARINRLLTFFVELNSIFICWSRCFYEIVLLSCLRSLLWSLVVMPRTLILLHWHVLSWCLLCLVHYIYTLTRKLNHMIYFYHSPTWICCGLLGIIERWKVEKTGWILSDLSWRVVSYALVKIIVLTCDSC